MDESWMGRKSAESERSSKNGAVLSDLTRMPLKALRHKAYKASKTWLALPMTNVWTRHLYSAKSKNAVASVSATAF